MSCTLRLSDGNFLRTEEYQKVGKCKTKGTTNRQMNSSLTKQRESLKKQQPHVKKQSFSRGILLRLITHYKFPAFLYA